MGRGHRTAAQRPVPDRWHGASKAAYVERSTGEIQPGPPKSKAGRRVVGIPTVIVPPLREHLADFVKGEPDALIFPAPKGGPLRRSNFNKLAAWPHAVRSIGAEGLHVHDLRILASPPLDFAVSDTYFLVAHFHYVLAGTVLFAMFAGFYFWWPKMTGKKLDDRIGKIHFWLMFVGFHTTFLVQHWIGDEGMPRRIPIYPDFPLWSRR